MNRAFALPRRRRRVDPYINLIAMLDTAFNLLIFFAVTMAYVGARSALPLRLPMAATTQPVPERIVLTLLPGRPVEVNGERVAADQIGSALRRAAAGDVSSQVVVVADEKVPYAQLISALDQARRAEFSRIALAATPKPRNARNGR